MTMVTVKADRAGLQLAKFGDVRLNGALVGQVRKVTQDGEEAEIHIALEPDAAKADPRQRHRRDPADHAVRAEVHRVETTLCALGRLDQRR